MTIECDSYCEAEAYDIEAETGAPWPELAPARPSALVQDFAPPAHEFGRTVSMVLIILALATSGIFTVLQERQPRSLQTAAGAHELHNG